MYKLKNWCCTVSGHGRYLPPEAFAVKLSGEVYDNPKFKDGSTVTTSAIQKAEGRKVFTYSGSVYYLEGPPEESYLEYLKDTGYPYDEDEPVRMIKDGRSKPSKTDHAD